MLRTKNLVAYAAALLWCIGATGAWAQTASHGLSIFGDLKYPPNFTHFDYVNPNAPKGGRLKLAGTDSYDTFNPFTLKGVAAHGAGLLFDTLMVRALDEPDSVYGLIAESVEQPQDRSWVVFNLRRIARWHDGSPVTADDVVFSFNTLIAQGHPVYRLLYEPVTRVEALGTHRVRFTFAAGQRDLAVQLASMPVISKRFYSLVRFDETTMEPPVGSGPYRIDRFEPGRSVVYRRDPGYWARDLPVNRGRHNFDRLQWDYYRDRGVALEAFFAGEYDFREEFVSRAWVTQYDKPPVVDGRIVKLTIPDRSPVGVQAFFFNLRREKFRDRRVRAALNLAFDFDWTNRTLFYGLYERTNSIFSNTDLAARGKPSPAERALLAPYRRKLPREVFGQAYQAAKTGGRISIRRNLLKARDLLRSAGWRVRQGALRNKAGEPFEIEFLTAISSFKRIILPYAAHLRRLGIDVQINIVDSANFLNRRNRFDFDVILERYQQFPTPGAEQRSYFGSAQADVTGTRNVAGIKDPVIDTLIDTITNAKDRPSLVTAARALDRVVMWGHYMIPHWYKAGRNVAYWDKFDRPKVDPDYGLGVLDTWWLNPKKADAIEAGVAPAR